MNEDEYGVTETGTVRHVVWMEPRAWCGIALAWLYPNPDSPGCPARVCLRCERVREANVRG